jgi:hypothetical protein
LDDRDGDVTGAAHTSASCSGDMDSICFCANAIISGVIFIIVIVRSQGVQPEEQRRQHALRFQEFARVQRSDGKPEDACNICSLPPISPLVKTGAEMRPLSGRGKVP